jgi:hypothetical protein
MRLLMRCWTEKEITPLLKPAHGGNGCAPDTEKQTLGSLIRVKTDLARP